MSDDDLIRREDALNGPPQCGQCGWYDTIAALPAVSAPVAVRVKPGAIERAVWSAMIWAASNNPGFDGLPEYTDGGNSFAEDEARAAARRIMAAIDAPDVAELVEAAKALTARWHSNDIRAAPFDLYIGALEEALARIGGQ